MLTAPPWTALRRPGRALSHVAMKGGGMKGGRTHPSSGSSSGGRAAPGGRAASGGRSVDISGTVPLLLVLVGIPGSGKSTFVQELLSGSPTGAGCAEWSRVSQDVLGSRGRCVRAAQVGLG